MQKIWVDLTRPARFVTSNYTAINSAISHHKLAKWELVNILEELKVETEKNYGHWWWTEQYERKKEDKRKWTHNLGIMSTLLFLLEPKYVGGLSFPMNLFQNLK